MFGWSKSDASKKAPKKALKEFRAKHDKCHNKMNSYLKEDTDFDAQQAILREFLPQIDYLYEKIEVLKTKIYLAEHEHLIVAVPPRKKGHEFWKECDMGRDFYLSRHGYAELEKEFHEARMRRYQRFQAWFTPCIAILALVVSIFSLAQDRSSKEVPPSKEVVRPHSHDPQQPKP